MQYLICMGQILYGEDSRGESSVGEEREGVRGGSAVIVGESRRKGGREGNQQGQRVC